MSNSPLYFGCKRFSETRENDSPEIVKGRSQFLYDTENNEYLDCINSVAIVGHCNQSVVQSTIQQMAISADMTSAVPKDPRFNYTSLMKETLPPHLDSLLFCNSGTEAVDLAIQIARLYTHGTDVICIENSFHGATESTCNISPKVNENLPEWTHTLPVPNFKEGDRKSLERHKLALKEVLDKAKNRNAKVACFLCEPYLVIPGCLDPPKSWLQQVYRLVREVGGLCIADEVQAGLGRTGKNFWSFEAQDVVPDIVIIGKGVGNGYPFSILATSSKLSSILGPKIDEYRCSPIVNSIGCAVLAELRGKNLAQAALETGSEFRSALLKIKEKHSIIKDVRGRGLLLGIEIGACIETQKSATEVTQDIVSRLKKKRILVASVGIERNILVLMPPLCFTKKDVLHFANTFFKILKDMKEVSGNDGNVERGSDSMFCTRDENIFCASPSHRRDRIHHTGNPVEGGMGIFQGLVMESSSNELTEDVFIPQSYDDPD